MVRVRSRRTQDSDPRNTWNIIKNLLGVLLVISLLLSAFWFSFLLGKRMLIPVKSLPMDKAVSSVASKEELVEEVFATRDAVVELKKREEIIAEAEKAEEVEELFPVKAKEQNKNESFVPAKTEKKVEVVVRETANTLPYKVQAGFFGQAANAKTLSEDLKTKGFENFIKALPTGFYRVQVGAFKTRLEAKSRVSDLVQAGFEGIIIYEK